jgi:hypothetical protein
MCVCSSRTPGHHGRGTRARALAGKGRFEHRAREMRHTSVNLMGRLTDIRRGGRWAGGTTQITVAAPVGVQVASGIVRFNRQVSADLAAKTCRTPN